MADETVFNPFTGEPDFVGGGGSGGTIPSGTVDGVDTADLPAFINTEQLAFKVFYQGVWLTFAQVSFDSLWDSQTDFWDSSAMDWDAPL